MIREWLNKLQAWRAARVRRFCKRQFLLDDAADFFAGKVSQEESRRRRDDFYRKLDAIPDEELLRM